MTNRYTCVLALLLFSLVSTHSQTSVPHSRKPSLHRHGERADTVLTGFVVDAACAKDMMGKPDVMKLAEAHTKKCALEETCAPSGYGIFENGVWHKFDARGDARAKDLIERTSLLRAILVDVKGRINGDTLIVASIGEHPPVSPAKKPHTKP
jgi:hypothetical protein